MIELTGRLIPRPAHDTGRRTVMVTGAMALAMIMVHWGWKTVGVVLFNLPEARFSQVTTVVPVFVALLVLIRTGLGTARDGEPS